MTVETHSSGMNERRTRPCINASKLRRDLIRTALYDERWQRSGWVANHEAFACDRPTTRPRLQRRRRKLVNDQPSNLPSFSLPPSLPLLWSVNGDVTQHEPQQLMGQLSVALLQAPPLTTAAAHMHCRHQPGCNQIRFRY